MDSGRPCCFCGHHLDAQGSHCLSCMAGGDAATLHNRLLRFLRTGGVEARPRTFSWTSSRAMVDAGLPTSFASQRWLWLKSCPMEPERYARSQFAWTLRSSMLWARTTGDTQLSDRDRLPTFTAQLKPPATTSVTSAGRRGTASGRICMRFRAVWPNMRTLP